MCGLFTAGGGDLDLDGLGFGGSDTPFRFLRLTRARPIPATPVLAA
eukprot:CAMPEP_0205942352 /NCGR_PEP_ID=MMETSP1325-20131115/57302_1 /ASSEMBLY_ACC=CAM_ASM_000708 /TAXON_ID=236786 /ORGANISM="Florenciella sp., Strain RCC1007" /LENGTH=45 /DNA_ID= /DNA_START= /DNA_END= /DNA_ORIENTATION=